MKYVHKISNVEKIRKVFGCPPYPWLEMEDAILLSASALTKCRVNMGNGNYIPSYSMFGIPHYKDLINREYKIISTSFTGNNENSDFFIKNELETAANLNLICRLSKSENKKNTLQFPRPGEKVTLRINRLIKQIHCMNRVHNVELRVVNCKARTLKGATCLVQVCRIF